MRNAMVPCVAVALSMALVFLAAAPQLAQGNPAVAVVSGAIAIIKPFVESYLRSLRNELQSGGVEIKLWTQIKDTKMMGCGFYFEVTSGMGRTKSANFPKTGMWTCRRDGDFVSRMIKPSSMYTKTIYMGNEQVRRIEVHADGWHDTVVRMMCFGLSQESIIGGPRAACITNAFLSSCQTLTNRWNATDLTAEDIKMTRSNRGIWKIVIGDIEKFVDGIEGLEANSSDENAARTACDNIDLVMGDAESDKRHCPRKAYRPIFLPRHAMQNYNYVIPVSRKWHPVCLDDVTLFQ